MTGTAGAVELAWPWVLFPLLQLAAHVVLLESLCLPRFVILYEVVAPIPRRSFFSSLGQESTWQCKTKQYGP